MISKRREKKPSREDAWQALASRRDGSIVLTKKGKLKEVRFRLDPFELVLDTYTQSTGESAQTYTRARILFPLRDEFRFRVYRRSIFSDIGKYFGMQDIEVGQPRFDRDFIVKSDSAGRVQALLLRSGVHNALITLKSGRFEVRKYRKRGVNTTSVRELRFTIASVLREAEKLDAIVDLFVESVEYMIRSGFAWPEPPPISL